MTAPPRLSDAVLAATGQLFASGRKVEMSDLAEVLEISRATLYRIVPDRRRLLVEYLWVQVDAYLAEARATTSQRGRSKVLDVLSKFLRAVEESEPFSTFVQREPAFALNILTTGSGIQPRLVDVLADLIAEARAEEPFAGGLDDRVLAYAIVRLGESFLYADAIAGLDRDVDTALQLIEMLISNG